MIDFNARLADPDPTRTARLVMDETIAEGRAAYRAGIAYKACPDFKVDHMRLDWQNGWRWERERHQVAMGQDA